MKRYRVKHNCTLYYGLVSHAAIGLHTGQIWEYGTKPSELSPLHSLTRQNVLIEVTNEDFERYFEPLESEGR